jgi:hypothetical protein
MFFQNSPWLLGIYGVQADVGSTKYLSLSMGGIYRSNHMENSLDPELSDLGIFIRRRAFQKETLSKHECR